MSSEKSDFTLDVKIQLTSKERGNYSSDREVFRVDLRKTLLPTNSETPKAVLSDIKSILEASLKDVKELLESREDLFNKTEEQKETELGILKSL